MIKQLVRCDLCKHAEEVTSADGPVTQGTILSMEQFRLWAVLTLAYSVQTSIGYNVQPTAKLLCPKCKVAYWNWERDGLADRNAEWAEAGKNSKARKERSK